MHNLNELTRRVSNLYVYTDSYVEAMRFDQYKLNINYIGICIVIIL